MLPKSCWLLQSEALITFNPGFDATLSPAGSRWVMCFIIDMASKAKVEKKKWSLCYHIEMISLHFSSVFSTHLKLKLRFASKRLTAIPKIRMSSPSTTRWLEVSRKFHSYLYVSESRMRVISDCPLIYHMLTSILLMEIETYHEIDLAVNYLTLWTKKKKKKKK